VALLGDSSMQLLSQAIRGYGYEFGLNLELHEANYNQIQSQIYNCNSQLYEFSPEVILICRSAQHLNRDFCALSETGRSVFAETHLQEVHRIYKAIMEHTQSAVVVYFNFGESLDAVFGHYANKVDTSFLWQLRRLNTGLMDSARLLTNLHICDLCSLQSRYGSELFFDPRLYVNADMVHSLDALPILAKHVTDIMLAVTGASKKCLILDLDNTAWGGVIGDDGIEHIQIGDLGVGKAFTELQLWAKRLRQRGIILAACSKNDELTAMEPFKDHPDMVLRLDDFSVFVANWDSKVKNIQLIQRTLNIGFEAMVFLDDNPFERNLVREHIAGIAVPELPEDPSDYIATLERLNLFEAASYTEEDSQRTRQYQDESKRISLQHTFANEQDFLASLNMVSTVKPFDNYTIPRVTQLLQRSNQFNLRTVRHTETEVQAISSSIDYLTFSFTLQDRFGDNGLISVVILERQKRTLFIDTWLMSCRVLGRGMEAFVLNELVLAAKLGSFEYLIGEYVQSGKNKMVKDHYANLGFEATEARWSLAVNQYAAKATLIKRAEA
jgi:FkbH-like protein